jgi:IS5 family transposase
MRIAAPQISFADAEMLAQGVLDRTLKRISDVLDQQGSLVDTVYNDLARGLKRSKAGRNGMTATQVLRSYILWRIKNWDMRELRERIADGYTTGVFTHFYSACVPNFQTFNRNFNRLTPETIRLLNEAVIQAAVDLGVEDGRKRRVDTTVVQTNIHFPTDSGLLWDVVRVHTRVVKQLRDVLGPALRGDFPDRTRRAKRRMQQISRMTGKKKTRQHVRKYRDLIQVAEEVMQKAAAIAVEAKPLIEGLDPISAVLANTLVADITEYGGLGQRVVNQSRRRVVDGEQVPVEEKLFSIFEPHTDLIKRGKIQTPVEFGHKVLIAESGNGLVTDYRVLDGNPPDQDQLQPSLEQHQKMFGKPPEELAADRGFHSDDNLAACKEAGVINECIPQCGGQKTPERKAHERSKVFKQGQRFRAGSEGRISVLFRGRGMKRCLCRGLKRFETFVGAAVLANNLLVLAGLLEKKEKRRRAA